MNSNIKTRNYEFIKDFYSKYLFLYEDHSERFGKVRVYQSLQKGVEFSLVAVKEVEIQQVEDKLKTYDQQMFSTIEEYIDDFMMAVEKVLDEQMNKHPNILQMIAFDCQGIGSNPNWKLNKITLYYEYFSNNIMQEAKRKYCYNGLGFPDTEIWQILYNISSTMSFLEGQNRWIGDLIPENIFYAHSNGEIKISPYKMSPLDDIKKKFIYVKSNGSQECNFRESNQFSLNTLCSLNITKYFKSDTLSLGISLLRVMICSDMFSFEVFEEMKKGYIEQTTLKNLLLRCSQKYDGFIMKVLTMMTDENEQNRPTGTDLFQFLSKYTQSIKQGSFNGSQITEFSFLEQNGNLYDFKKSPSLFASQKFAQMIRKNSFALDGQTQQEDENNKMQKILDSVKKIISKKIITENQSSLSKESKNMLKKENEMKDRVDNDTYESLTEITAKESIADLQQIPTDNQLYTNRNINLPSFPNFPTKSGEITKNQQISSKSNLNNNSETNTKALKNITNMIQQPIPEEKQCDFERAQLDQENTKKSNNSSGLLKSQNQYQSNSNTSMINNTFANNYYNSLYPPPKKNDYSINQAIKIQDLSNQNLQSIISPKTEPLKSLNDESTNAVSQHLNSIHTRQLDTIKLAYQELSKIKEDISVLTLQRQSLLEQNKRLMEINGQLIQQNKDKAFSTAGLLTAQKQTNGQQYIIQDIKLRERALSSERFNQPQLQQQYNSRQSSHSQPPLHFIDATHSPELNPMSSQNLQKQQVSKTPILAIPRRELNLPSKNNSQPVTTQNSPQSIQSQNDFPRSRPPTKYQNQIIQLHQKPANNYSVKSSFKDGVYEQDFILSDEQSSKNIEPQVDTLIVSPIQKRITQIRSPKTCEMMTAPRKNSFLLESSDFNTQMHGNNNLSNLNPLSNQKSQSNNSVSTFVLSKLVSNGQTHQGQPLFDSQQFGRASVRSQMYENNNSSQKVELNNGKCINIYQIRSPSNSISRDASPALLNSPPNTHKEKQEFIGNGIDGTFSLNNNQVLKQNNQQLNYINQNSNASNDDCRKLIRHMSSHQPVNNPNNMNFYQNENQFDKRVGQETINRNKSNSMQLFYPLHLHNRQSRISTITSNNNNNLNTYKYSESTNNTTQTKTSQLVNGQIQQVLYAKQNSFTENDKTSFQPLISSKLDEKLLLKKSSSLPKPSPTLNSSNQKDLKQSRIIPIINNENMQRINYPLNNNYLDPKRNLNFALNTQMQVQPLNRSNDQQQYAVIHRRQQSLTESQKLGQAINIAPTINLKNENKLNGSQTQLKTIQNIGYLQSNQKFDIQEGQKGYAQIYNQSNTPTSQKNQQSTMKNSFTQLNQNTLQSDRQPSQQQNSFTQILQRTPKILTQVSTSLSKKEDLFDKSNLNNDTKIVATKSPKNIIPPPFMGVGILKKTDIKNTLNENPLKTLQSNIKNQYAK